MKDRICAALAGVLLVVILLSVPRPAAAHGDEPRLEISPETLSPGMVLQIRGVGFEFEEQISLVLQGWAGELPLEAVVADAEGPFMLAITVPAELAEGAYFVHASTDDHEVDSPYFTVSGTAVGEGGGQGVRDEDDVLLAPMPTYEPGASSTPMPAAQTSSEPEKAAPLELVLLGALVLGVIGMALLWRARRAR